MEPSLLRSCLSIGCIARDGVAGDSMRWYGITGSTAIGTSSMFRGNFSSPSKGQKQMFTHLLFRTNHDHAHIRVLGVNPSVCVKAWRVLLLYHGLRKSQHRIKPPK